MAIIPLIVDNMKVPAEDMKVPAEERSMSMNARAIGLRRATLADEARLEIERMITDGDLSAGEKLNELELSTAMGVSRGTVREAIRSLVGTGLVNSIANRGAFVHRVTLAEVQNLYELRGAIFAMACAAVARRVRDGEESGLATALNDNIARMDVARAAAEPTDYYGLNIEFHDLLLMAADNPKAKSIYDNIKREMHLFRRRGLSIAPNIARSLDEHRAIAAAVISGDPEAARIAAHYHITQGFDRYMTIATRDRQTG